MMVTRRSPQRAAVLTLLSCLLAVPAAASGPVPSAPQLGGTMRPAPRPLLGPAGPTPLNPAGPTPLNPAGPSPLDPTGRSMGVPRRAVQIQQHGVFVGVVGGGANLAVPLRGSFYCQVHNRGYATQSLFLDHLAVADGIARDEAMSSLVENGGIWVFPVE